MDKRETVVNDKKYEMILPAVRKGMPLGNKALVLVGPLFSSLGADAKAGGMAAFGKLLQGVDPLAVDALLMEAVSISHLCCNGESISAEINFEKHFNQYRNEVYQVCVWCLWESVRDFFPPWLLEVCSHLASKLPKESLSQKDGK